MSGGSGVLPFSIECFGEIELRVHLIWIYVHRLFPGIHGLVGMAEARGQQSVIHESVNIARKYLQHFPVVRISIGVAAVFDHGASVLML